MNTGENDATCIAFDTQHGLTFPTVSGSEGGGTAVNNAYNPTAYPTIILIAPDHTIVEQDIWPIGPIINIMEGYNITPHDCGSTLTAGFTSDVTETCISNEVTFTNNSLGTITAYEWTFEGGDPATSDEENPVVTYNEAGVYDVTLKVTNGLEEATVVMEDYMTVHEITAAFEATVTDICDLEQIQFTDNSLCATSWEWTFEGGDPATSTEQNPIITYNTAGNYSVSLTVTNDNGENTMLMDSYVTVHNCTGLAEYSELEMNITPNPSNGLFTIGFSADDYYDVYVYDITGHIVYDTRLSNKQNQLNLSHLENGVYIIKASNGTAQIKERVVIQK